MDISKLMEACKQQYLAARRNGYFRAAQAWKDRADSVMADEPQAFPADIDTDTLGNADFLAWCKRREWEIDMQRVMGVSA